MAAKRHSGIREPLWGAGEACTTCFTYKKGTGLRDGPGKITSELLADAVVCRAPLDVVVPCRSADNHRVILDPLEFAGIIGWET